MANISYNDHVEEMHGIVLKDGVIHRRKTFRNERGKIIGKGKPEGYKIEHPRDLSVKPLTENEQANQNRWTLACREASRIYHAYDPESGASPELKRLYRDFEQRFKAQLPGKSHSKPDPSAPIDKRKHRQKKYHQFLPFIRAMIYHENK